MKVIEPSYELMTDIPGDGLWVLKDLEKSARVCYKSEDRITDDGESARKLLRELLNNGHEAMLEGYSLKVKFICDRGVSHELVRHRLCSFAQESTRYCNYSKGKFGNEITVIEPVIFSEMTPDRKLRLFETWCDGDDGVLPDGYDQHDTQYLNWFSACKEAEDYYMAMVENGATPEIARSVLPTCLKTEIIMYANLREWRHIFHLRTSKRAHPEMRRLMVPLLDEVHSKIPLIFDDLWARAFSDDPHER